MSMTVRANKLTLSNLGFYSIPRPALVSSPTDTEFFVLTARSGVEPAFHGSKPCVLAGKLSGNNAGDVGVEPTTFGFRGRRAANCANPQCTA